MLGDLDLVGGKREAGHRPEAGQGLRCLGQSPEWGPPEEKRKRETNEPLMPEYDSVDVNKRNTRCCC